MEKPVQRSFGNRNVVLIQIPAVEYTGKEIYRLAVELGRKIYVRPQQTNNI